MSYPHQPGSPEFDGSAAYEAYLDEIALRAENARLRAEIERLRVLSQNNAHAWDALVRERDELREKLKALTGRDG